MSAQVKFGYIFVWVRKNERNGFVENRYYTNFGRYVGYII